MSDAATIWIDGEGYAFDDFTFRERREISRIIRELGDNPEDPEDATFLPACVVVIRRRTDPGYTVEQALDLKPSDLVKPARPTRASKKTPA